MDYKPLLPPPLMEAEHIKALDKLMRNYLAGDDDLGNEAVWYYSTVLNFDTVPAVILPYLAKMFGVEGFKGFDYAPTEALKRQMLKTAMVMHRRHGTTWTLKTALENAGYLNVKIIDHLQPLIFWNGAFQFDGSQQFNSQHWAHFKIEMEPPVGVAASSVNIPVLMKYINHWKRASILCVGVQINQLVITNFGIGDNAEIVWDGTEQFNGNVTFGG